VTAQAPSSGRLASRRFDNVAPAVSCALSLLFATGPFAAARRERRAPLYETYPGLPEGDGPETGMVWIEGGRFTMGSRDWAPGQANLPPEAGEHIRPTQA
jgi:formylglycine-generating enzyme required for sulfatase activity